MKKLFLAGILLLSVQGARADFSRTRDTVAKSSFTALSVQFLPISSASAFTRSITLSGTNVSTITLFDAQIFATQLTTRAVIYWPGGLLNPITLDVPVVFSSGILMLKNGACYTNLNWDWYTEPVNSDGTKIINPTGTGN